MRIAILSPVCFCNENQPATGERMGIDAKTKWFTDDRRFIFGDLINDQELADGIMMNVWKMAEDYWSDEKKLIPKALFMRFRHAQSVIDSGLAVEKEPGKIYVRGTEEHLSWREAKRRAGKAGGQKTQQNRRPDESNSSTCLSRPEAGAKAVLKQCLSRTQAPSTLVPLYPSSLKEYSVGQENQKPPVGQTAIAVADDLNQVIKKENGEAGKRGSVQKFIAAYVKAYEKRFPGQRPMELADGRIQGQIKQLMKTFPVEKACELAEAYFQIDDPWFEKRGYAFDVFRANLNKIDQLLSSGNTSTTGINWQKFMEGKQ